jgi:acid phosphatase family membrane protein YuiD
MIWYAILPVVAWFVLGIIKFGINAIRFGGAGEAKKRAGNGGFPSTHTSVVTTTIAYIGFMEGLTSLVLAF